MKITISFNHEEKRVATEIVTKTYGITEITDKDEHIAGKFGEFKYDSKENVIEFELKTAFIKAYACLIENFANLVKSFMGSCQIFASSWLEDIEDLTEKKEEKECSNEPVGDMAEH